MKLSTGWKFAGLALSLAWLPATHAAGDHASDFPNKPIRWIVPFPPGGSNDTLARFIGMKLGDRLHEQVVIDNRGGANGIIGTELAAHTEPDGYTMLMVSTSYVMNAAVRELPYDVEKSFDPIAMIASSPNSIVVSPKSQFGSLRELVEYAKANPGKLNYASTGVGGFNHFGGELFKKVAGINLVHVPFKGGNPGMTAVIAGEVPVMFSSLTQVMPNVRGGRLKLLAVGSQERSPVVPDVPTVIESGFPGYDVSVWWGIVAPHGTPRAALDKLRHEINAVLAQADVKKHLLADAAQPKIMTPGEMGKLIHASVQKWKDVAKTANIHIPSEKTAAR